MAGEAKLAHVGDVEIAVKLGENTGSPARDAAAGKTFSGVDAGPVEELSVSLPARLCLSASNDCTKTDGCEASLGLGLIYLHTVCLGY